MEITLIRHGKSKLHSHSPLTCREFGQWLELYDGEGVIQEVSYPRASIMRARHCGVLVTSDLNRALESAYLLAPNRQPQVVDPLFRELDYPNPALNFWGIKWVPLVWMVFFRILGMMGYEVADCESYGEAKVRAKKAALLLVEYAKEEGSAVLVGHGFFNFMLSRELRKLGWFGALVPSARHWISTTYRLK